MARAFAPQVPEPSPAAAHVAMQSSSQRLRHSNYACARPTIGPARADGTALAPVETSGHREALLSATNATASAATCWRKQSAQTVSQAEQEPRGSGRSQQGADARSQSTALPAPGSEGHPPANTNVRTGVAAMPQSAVAGANEQQTALSACKTGRTPCGVRLIWTSAEHRRRGIATKLLDAARAVVVPGAVIPRQHLAFAQPTDAGCRLILRYTGQIGFLVY